jgi:hypothetical protein
MIIEAGPKSGPKRQGFQMPVQLIAPKGLRNLEGAADDKLSTQNPS